MSVFSSPWLYISIIILFLIIAILIAIYQKPKADTSKDCVPGTVMVCDHECIIPCPADKPNYNCQTKQCECPPNSQPCSVGAGCCPPGNCNSGICCQKELVIMVNGQAQCCQGGAVASRDGKSCVVPCGGKNGKVCASNEACVMISGVTPDMASKLKAMPDFDKIGSISGTNAYICQNKDSQCTFGTGQSIPSVVPDNVSPCYNLVGVKTSSDGIGYCTSTNAANIAACRTKGKSECGAPCNWVDLLSAVSEDFKNGGTNVISNLSKTFGFSDKGYFCSPDQGNYSKFLSYGKTSNICSWKDCFTKISQPGVTNVYWDEKQGICTALASCNSNSGGLGNKIVCLGKDDPITGCTPGKLIDNDKIITYKNDFGKCIKPVPSTCGTLKPPYSCDKNGQIVKLAPKCPPISGKNGFKINALWLGFLAQIQGVPSKVYAEPNPSNSMNYTFYANDDIMQFSKAYRLRLNDNSYLSLQCSQASYEPVRTQLVLTSNANNAIYFKFIPSGNLSSPDAYICAGDKFYMKAFAGTGIVRPGSVGICPGDPIGNTFYKNGKFRYQACKLPNSDSGCYFQYEQGNVPELQFYLV